MTTAASMTVSPTRRLDSVSRGFGGQPDGSGVDAGNTVLTMVLVLYPAAATVAAVLAAFLLHGGAVA